MEEKQRQVFQDFSKQPVQVITVDDLAKTHLENYPDGTPVGGIYHITLIQEMLRILLESGHQPVIKEVFCANNKFRRSPGVSVLPEVAQRYGEGSLESHIMRRVFCNIELQDLVAKDADNGDAMCYNIALSYTQNGILIGVGPYVYACHNQSIVHADRMLANYTVRGMQRLATEARKVDYLLLKFKELVESIPGIYQNDLEDVKLLRNTMLDGEQINQFLGGLLLDHESATTDNPLLYCRKTAPLTAAQLSVFARNLLQVWYDRKVNRLSAWEVINAANTQYKPRFMPFENIVPQALALHESMHDFITKNVMS